MHQTEQLLNGTAKAVSDVDFSTGQIAEQKEAVAGKCHRVPLLNGGVALVDTADLHLISGQKWYEHLSKHLIYAHSTTGGLMHRIIMGLKEGDGLRVDHIDRNGLNNTRANLRVGTQGQNRANSHKLKAASSHYKGVWKAGNVWRAKVHKLKPYYLGTFSTEEEAALAYNAKAIELFGEFACLNQIPHLTAA